MGPTPVAARPHHATRHVSCGFDFEVGDDAVLVLQIAAQGPTVADERLDLSVDDDPGRVTVVEQPTAHGGRTHLVRAGRGLLRIRYAASVTPELGEAADAAPPDVDPTGFDDDAIVALRQSRYCESDALAGFAATEFSGVARHELPTAVASWVFERFSYEPGSSGPLDTALDTLVAHRGVCRDFAHVAITLCRSLGIPARLAAVYAPGLSPMDFHAVVEVRTGPSWYVIDPTRLAPRSALVRIATGRDAADTAFATTLHGEAELTSAEVSAVIDGDLPPDDHRSPVMLS